MKSGHSCGTRERECGILTAGQAVCGSRSAVQYECRGVSERAQYLKGRENHGTSDQNECSGSVQSFMTGESGTERIKGIISGRNTA